MQEMLEEPRAQYVDGPLRQSPLRPPGLLLHHAHLVESPLLPQALVKQLEPRRLTLGYAGAARAILLAQQLAAVLQLGGDRVLQAPEVPRHGFLRKGGVRDCRSVAHHEVEHVHHHLHLLAIVVVSSLHLQKDRGLWNSFFFVLVPISECHIVCVP